VVLTVHLRIEERVGFLTLDRPEKANAYNAALLEALKERLDEVEQADVIDVLVVASAGDGAFCGGADLKEINHATPEDARELVSQKLFDRLANLQQVTIAAVQGAAFGGGLELAMACDLRVAGPSARFALPETSLGLIPTAGGCTRLPRLIGVSRAKEMILGGRQIDAETALDWGLVHRLVGRPRENALEWAKNIRQLDAVALAAAKRVIDREDLSASLRHEREEEALLYHRRHGSND